MQKPVVFNRHLNKKWGEKENDIMINKLHMVKAQIDIKCPESFMFYKTQFKKINSNPNQLREFETRRNNKILVEKIMNIFTSTNQKEESKKKPLFKYKENIFSQTRKWDIYKTTQDNQLFFKRLNERQSNYSASKWERDYEQSKKYKKNICIFPSVNFDNPNKNESFNQTDNFKSTSLYSKLLSANILKEKPLGSKNAHSSRNYFYNSGNQFDNSPNSDRKVLYSKKVFLGELLHCFVNFYVENKKFHIEVDTTLTKKRYFIVFDDVEEISKIQKLYKKYEQIITDIEYNQGKDEIHIRNIKNIQLNYKSFVTDMNTNINNEDEDNLPNLNVYKLETKRSSGNEVAYSKMKVSEKGILNEMPVIQKKKSIVHVEIPMKDKEVVNISEHHSKKDSGVNFEHNSKIESINLSKNNLEKSLKLDDSQELKEEVFQDRMEEEKEVVQDRMEEEKEVIQDRMEEEKEVILVDDNNNKEQEESEHVEAVNNEKQGEIVQDKIEEKTEAVNNQNPEEEAEVNNEKEEKKLKEALNIEIDNALDFKENINDPYLAITTKSRISSLSGSSPTRLRRELEGGEDKRVSFNDVTDCKNINEKIENRNSRLNEVEEEPHYITYSQAKESNKTLSRASKQMYEEENNNNNMHIDDVNAMEVKDDEISQEIIYTET